MPAATTSKKLLTPREAALRLGWKADSVRKAAREGRIPSKKIGGRVFIPESTFTVESRATPEAPEA